MVDKLKIGDLKLISATLVEEIISCDAYNPQNKFVNLDFLWQNPESCIKTGKLIADYLTNRIADIKDVRGIISVDSVIFPYGPIPLAVQVSSCLKIPLSIWKENDNPITGSHRLFGKTPENNGLILYDVTRYGLTALNTINFLRANGVFPRWFVTIIDCGEEAKSLLDKEVASKSKEKFEFINLINLDEIVDAYSRNNIDGKLGL